MPRRLPLPLRLFALALAFAALVYASSLLPRGARIDLTANRLYTLSPGTEHILASNREPIRLQLFVSDRAMRDLPALRAYAQRVRELVEEMAARSHATISVQTIDPQPYTDAEDSAAQAGLQAVPVGVNSAPVYFGLVGTNSHGVRSIDPFFDPAKEVFLEYDIARLIVSLSGAHKPVLAVLSSLPNGPGFDPASGQVRPGWAIDSELSKTYELRRLEANPSSIGSDVDLLILIHPKNLSEDTAYAIDQFVMRGGRLLAFVDPDAESDPLAASQPRPAEGGGLTPVVSSNLPRLFKAWGIEYDPGKIVRDPANALQTPNAAGQPVANPVMLGLTKDGLDQNDVVTAQLDSLNLSTAGSLALDAGSKLTMEPLAWSSTHADLVEADRVRLQTDPTQLAAGFHATGKAYVLAARFTGPLASAFPARADAHHLATTKQDANLIVVADTDVLTDRLWVRAQDFFGRRLLNPFARNGDFIANAVDNLSGAADLIGLRARQGFVRPFTRVQKMRQRADDRLRGKQQELQAQLKTMEEQLASLQGGKAGQGAQAVDARAAAQIEQFQQQRQRVRGELRDVQHQLDASIEQLGTRLKLLDILGVPLLLTLIVSIVAWRRRRPRQGAD
ncbi:MAG: Gldg family protein [Proteobacteria bacterium]|nr:Gldg family protein [Pseudomonadota bacterium]